MNSYSPSKHLPVIFQNRVVLIAAFCGLVLAGCASSSVQKGADGQANIEALILQAENELGKGRRDQAIAILNQAVKESPTSSSPWLKMSNIWFDEGNYPSSILAANEALARDESNQEAKSIMVVAGLRVAASAVKGLVPQGLASSNARTEAENLTKSLRLALGEKVLVPSEPVVPAALAVRARTRAKSVTAQNKPATEAVMPAKAVPSSVQIDAPSKVSVSVDPFKSLK